MARTNTAAVNAPRVKTHEGGPARIPKPEAQLERQVASCMLFENTFYEKGSQIAAGIEATCEKVPVEVIANTAIKARNAFKLRHVPLFLLAQLNKRRRECAPGLVAATVESVVQRPDELCESLAILAKVENKPIKKAMSHAFEKGLAKAFKKFSQFQLSKWNRDNAIKLKDVLFLTHAKPTDGVRGYTRAARKRGVEAPRSYGSQTFTALVGDALPVADTWEVALSAGADKKATWERLLSDGRLGYMALLMNLRNMEAAGVRRDLVAKALLDGAPNSRALPFRFVSAARHAPTYAPTLSSAMLSSIDRSEQLPGITYFMLDVSGSMDDKMSGKSEVSRWETGAALGVLLREVCSEARVFTFSDKLVECSAWRGLPLIDGIGNSQNHNGTFLASTLRDLFKNYPTPDRVVVITDEQACDGIDPLPKDVRHGYVVNVAAYAPGLALDGRWTRINGFSERIVDFMRYEEEAE